MHALSGKAARPSAACIAPRNVINSKRPAVVICRGKASSFKDEFFEISQQLEALKVKLESGGPSSASSTSKAETEAVNSLGYACDENGCVLLDADETEFAAGSDDGVLDSMLTGQTWSLGMLSESDGQGYCAEVGGSEWSVSLTAAELKDFITALKAIREAVVKMSEANGSEPIRAKWDTQTVKLEANCDATQCCKDKFGLKFMVGGLRLVRGTWSGQVVSEVLTALDEHVPGFAPPPAAAAAAPAVPVAAARQ